MSHFNRLQRDDLDNQHFLNFSLTRPTVHNIINHIYHNELSFIISRHIDVYSTCTKRLSTKQMTRFKYTTCMLYIVFQCLPPNSPQKCKPSMYTRSVKLITSGNNIGVKLYINTFTPQKQTLTLVSD